MSRGTACCSDHTPAAVSGRPREGESRSTGELVLFKSNLQLRAIMLQAIEGNYTVHQLEVKVHFVVRELERASQMSTIRTRSLRATRDRNTTACEYHYNSMNNIKIDLVYILS